MRSVPTTRSCLPPVTISPARRRRGWSPLLTRLRLLTWPPLDSLTTTAPLRTASSRVTKRWVSWAVPPVTGKMVMLPCCTPGRTVHGDWASASTGMSVRRRSSLRSMFTSFRDEERGGDEILHGEAKKKSLGFAVHGYKASERPCDQRFGEGAGVLRSALRRSEEHTSELQSRQYLVCRLLLEKKKYAGPDRPARAELAQLVDASRRTDDGRRARALSASAS